MYQPILFTHQGAPWMDPYGSLISPACRDVTVHGFSSAGGGSIAGTPVLVSQ